MKCLANLRLDMNTGTPQTYGRALYELTRGKRGAELNEIIERFVAHLSKARMLTQADRIINECIRYAKAKEGIVEIEIQSARELPAATINQVKKYFGDKVAAASTVNEALLGGIAVRTQDAIFDASLRAQLNTLEMKLAS